MRFQLCLVAQVEHCIFYGLVQLLLLKSLYRSVSCDGTKPSVPVNADMYVM